jgi:RNA polymerase sigma-70 factor, ECF subfamily
VRDADLADATQEVFIVVSSKLGTLEPGVRMTTWLYGIALRVGANQRRKVERKREELSEETEAIAGEARGPDPEEALAREEARRELAEVLDAMPAEQRIVFEMFELEEVTCPAIAEALGIPLGTTYTRLRAARATFAAKAEERARRREGGA